jgi:hypothetical protein
MQQIVDLEKFNFYARPLFVSPHFVRFTRAVFHAILQPMLRSPANQIAFRVSHVLDSYAANIVLLPVYIREILFVSSDAVATLRDAFWKPFLATPQNWLGRDTWEEVSESITHAFRSLLEKGGVQEKLSADIRFHSMFQHNINTQTNAASHQLPAKGLRVL